MNTLSSKLGSLALVDQLTQEKETLNLNQLYSA